METHSRPWARELSPATPTSVGTCQPGAPTASLCKVRAPSSWPYPTPGPLRRLVRIASHSSHQERTGPVGPQGPRVLITDGGKQQHPGGPGLPGEEGTASQGVSQAPFPRSATQLTSRAQGLPWKEGCAPSWTAEMLQLAWWLSDQGQLPVAAGKREPHSQPELFPADTGPDAALPTSHGPPSVCLQGPWQALPAPAIAIWQTQTHANHIQKKSAHRPNSHLF